MKTETDRCMGCMNIKENAGPCKICGYIDNDAYPAACLAPRTLLADRYIIGKLITKCGEGWVYLAFDTAEDHAVEIKEFMPDTLCTRAEDGENVIITDGCLPLYKSYLSEFADLHKSLMSEIQSDCLKKECNIFSAFGTGYVVTEHIDGITLEEYLKEHGGRLDWQTASELFKPLFGALTMLHSKGIVHRGISPDTLCVTKDGRLVLTSIDISAARSAESQMTCVTYPGYTACEQYDTSERQGSWTDVYGISAVLYRTLTGTVPPDASERKTQDKMADPVALNGDIPVSVSDAIISGMSIAPTERLRTINELGAELYRPAGNADGSGDGPVAPRVAIKPEHDRYAYDTRKVTARKPPSKKPAKKKKKDPGKSANIGTAIGLGIFLALVIALVIAIIYFSGEAKRINDETASGHKTLAEESTTPPDDTEPEPDITAAPVTQKQETTKSADNGDKMVVPDFTNNRLYNAALENQYPMLKFEVVYEYSDEAEKGFIFEQSIEPGTIVGSGTPITIKVSQGLTYALLPDYIGKKVEDYEKELQKLGISYTKETEETGEVKAGYVSRCSKEINEKIMLSDNESIIVYVAKKPKETTPPETEPEPTDPDDEDSDFMDGDDEDEDTDIIDRIIPEE